ncbi:pyridoxal phosphate enzyme (YggS family) [Peptoniphilus ivorii]|uniref:YggS family pyridoxal phosphate-dependent enzyme n=1 Tax=Aedoeadaptatus ivorii TaxID=54006 RepID=UPI00278AD867|nr:YggS family pyridoxal phosphate-dependent enzyme [Peptoniphilus ivorii]MDQ0507728.1 pyridoxal phosphate enzyme (YggS family) [Peptoniphilus ivorii]
MSEIGERISRVKEEIEEARSHSITGEPVELIAVTKTHDVKTIREAIVAGATDIGENKVQELRGKIEEIGPEVRYHMIGNLQSNKVKYIYQDVVLIHSLDRKSLAKEIEKRAQQTNDIVRCLLEVNIGRESSKGGLLFEKVLPFLESILDYSHIKIDGLMTVAPAVDDENYLRALFRKMFALKEDIALRNYKDVDMKYLSMGMSNDFPIAIEEGANMVRIGSRIFGARTY